MAFQVFKLGQDGPKMVPGRPKMAQVGPKMAQGGSKMASRWPKMAQDGPKDAPKVALETAKVGGFQKQAFRIDETQVFKIPTPIDGR